MSLGRYIQARRLLKCLGMGCVWVCVGVAAEPQQPKSLLFTDEYGVGLPWVLVLPNLDMCKTNPVSVGHEREVLGDVDLFEKWYGAADLQESFLVEDSILWASSALYVSIRRSNRPPVSIRRLSGDWRTYDAGLLEIQANQRAAMARLIRSRKSVLERLIGSIALGFLGELGQNRRAANILFNEGLTYDHPMVVVKSAIALIMGGVEKDRDRLARVWDRFTPEVQDRLVLALLTKNVRMGGVRGFYLLPLLDAYLVGVTGVAKHHPHAVETVRRYMDLIGFEEMLRAAPQEWLTRLKLNRIEAIREIVVRWYGKFAEPDQVPHLHKIPDSDMWFPEINLVSSAMFVFLNTPPGKQDEPFFKVARRIVMSEVDRVSDLPSGLIRDYEELSNLIQLIRRSDFIGTYERFLADPDLEQRAWAAVAILLKNWEFDRLDPQEGAHPQALSVVRELIASGYIPAKMRRPLGSFEILTQHLHRLDQCSRSSSP